MSYDPKRTAQQTSLRNPIILVLLAGIAASLLILFLLISVNALGCGSGRSSASSEQSGSITGEALNAQAKPHKPIGDPNRIKGVLKEGRTYRIILKAGIQARVEDRAYSIKTLTNMLYVGEFVISRKIERNNGVQVVELRTFERCSTVKLESHVEDLQIDWGLPGELALLALDVAKPEVGAAVTVAKPILEGIMRSFRQSTANAQVEAWRQFDSLSGKTVRIVYQDGEGVVGLEPVGCSLTADEISFLSNTASLSDYYLLPDLKVKPGTATSWSVDAFQLSSLIDPSLRGVPRGEVEVYRQSDPPLVAGTLVAALAIERGYVELDSSDDKAIRVGSFVPRGRLLFNVTDGYLGEAELTGDIKVDQVSKNHLLFETSMRTQPKLTVQYHCTMK